MDHSGANPIAGTDMGVPAMTEDTDMEPQSEKAETGGIGPERGSSPGGPAGANKIGKSTRKSLSFKLAFIGLAASNFVFQLDATCLGIALPSFWANLAYALCGLVMQPVSASVSNAFGRKPPLYACIALFLVGSVVFARAEHMSAIVVARVLQGLGGGGIDVLSDIVLTDMTTLEERAAYLGLMAIPSAVGNIMGPVVAALSSTYVSWRWIGWVNLPLLGIALTLTFFFLKLRPIPLDVTLAGNLKRLDWIGMALIIIGITIFVVPLSWAGSVFPWASWQTLLPLFSGVAVLVVFAFYEATPVAPIVPHRIFHSKTGNVTLLGGFFHGIVLVSILQYLPLLYQAVELESPVASAVSLLPTVIVSVVVAAVSMMMVPLFGGYVWLLRLSWVITALGTGLLALFNVASSSSMRHGLPILWGQGVALLRLNLLPMQASVKHVDDTGLAIAQFQAIRMFGGLVGLTVSASIFNNVFSRFISDVPVPLTGALSPLGNASNAVNFIDKLSSLEVSPATLDQVLRVYLQSFRTIFYTLTAFAGLGLTSSMFIDEIDLKRQDLGNQRFED